MTVLRILNQCSCNESVRVNVCRKNLSICETTKVFKTKTCKEICFSQHETQNYLTFMTYIFSCSFSDIKKWLTLKPRIVKNKQTKTSAFVTAARLQDFFCIWWIQGEHFQSKLFILDHWFWLKCDIEKMKKSFLFCCFWQIAVKIPFASHFLLCTT